MQAGTKSYQLTGELFDTICSKISVLADFYVTLLSS
ncbi:Uncharacterised protein [BD1-7 clade bacterium]|uniref:Uncharacterized protein n=1 Tax=BD1-7 clade bacterium TaxID=2029982 RepID=A0A5S9N5A6_9GAMM|nr:Uncharacterised protein [BD1-7 clade bacterium]CAA0085005.1 Uncharacterised protein [BD1-7 clade bacterium]